MAEKGLAWTGHRLNLRRFGMRLRTQYADEGTAEAVKLPFFVTSIQPALKRMPSTRDRHPLRQQSR
jgi:hypothetical protein